MRAANLITGLAASLLGLTGMVYVILFTADAPSFDGVVATLACAGLAMVGAAAIWGGR